MKGKQIRCCKKAGEVGNHDGEQLPRWGGDQRSCVLPQYFQANMATSSVAPLTLHALITPPPPPPPPPHPPPKLYEYENIQLISIQCVHIYLHIYQLVFVKQQIYLFFSLEKERHHLYTFNILYVFKVVLLYLTGVVLGRLGNTHSWGGLVEVETVLLELVGREVRNGDKECSFFCLHLLFFHYSFTHQPHYVLRSHNS